jgi:hypothetical protein
MLRHVKRQILSVGGLGAILAVSAVAFAQAPQTPKTGAAKTAKAAEPARPHDIEGAWMGSPGPTRFGDVGELTAWGKEQFDANKPFNAPEGRIVPVGESNDPLSKCDPLGFPRDIFYETRGIDFVQTQRRVLELFQYQRIWREIWTDGRKLPVNVGNDKPDSVDPRWYGYSIGHWDGDYTFVVETTGVDERGWLDTYGYPHSAQLKTEERYRRVDHDNLEIIVKIDDPKAYVKPFVTKPQVLKWNPKEEVDEQMCVPSEAEAYWDAIGSPGAGTKTK